MHRETRRLAAIVAADVAGFSRMVGRDEEGTLRALRAHRQEFIDGAIADHGGRIANTAGDSLLLEFTSVVAAVRCAVAIQDVLAARNHDVPDDRRIRLRMGINIGDVVADGDDLLGDGVNIAARLEGLAEPGGILISDDALRQVRGRIDTPWDDFGEHALKNIDRPVRVWRWARLAGTQDTAAPPPAADKQSIAVLAFDNMSRDPDQEYFSDGISEDIITDLSKVDGLHVIARNSSFAYKHDAAVSIPKVGRELNARYVVEGSVRKAGNRIRVNAQLIDATSGGHLWAERYDRDLTDIFEVQDELTREIVAALKLTLTAADERRLTNARARTVDTRAYELLLRAREQVWQHTKASNAAARNLLASALEVDPDFAAAHAINAFAHAMDYVNGWSDDPDGSLRTAMQLAERAVAMDDTEAQAHFAFAVSLLWTKQLDRAAAEAERCLALEPSSAEGHMIKAHIQIFSGESAAALATLEAYFKLDPLHPDIALYFLADAHFNLGDYEAAVAALNRRLQRSPESPTTHAMLACSLGQLDRHAEARAAWRRALQADPNFSMDRRRHVLPYRDPAFFERRLDGLRKVGLIS